MNNVSPPATGDCVIATGTIAQFHGATELSPGAIMVTSSSDCDNVTITPFAATVADVATDTDLGTSDNQPGDLAEPLESVLVKLSPVTVQTTNGGSGAFVVGDATSGAPILSVGNFFYQYGSTTGTSLQLTGTLDEFDPMPTPPTNFYQLLPRNAADIVVLP